MIITVDGIEVLFTRKNVRRITLKVDSDGTVKVSAPKSASVAVVEKFVRSKIEWIRASLERKKDGPFFSVNGDDGDKITVFGNTYVVKHVLDGGKTAELAGGFLLLHLSEKNYEKRDKILRGWMKSALEKEVIASLKKWHALTGLDCSDVVFKDMSSRWGSCNVVTKKLCFSLRLLSQQIRSVDYVVLHELTHTVYRAHDKNFYGYVARFMPDYKTANKALVMPVKSNQFYR